MVATSCGAAKHNSWPTVVQSYLPGSTLCVLPSSTWFLGPPKWHLDWFSHFCRQRDRPRYMYNMCSNCPYLALLAVLVMRANIIAGKFNLMNSNMW